MPIKRIEALADGIAYLNKAHEPNSDAFQLRNPGLVRAYSYRHLGEVDNKGRRIFTSIIGGYRFLVQDLTWKCAGETRAKGYSGRLSPTSDLTDLLKSFNIAEEQVFALAEFLTVALKDDTINGRTKLSYFLEP